MKRLLIATVLGAATVGALLISAIPASAMIPDEFRPPPIETAQPVVVAQVRDVPPRVVVVRTGDTLTGIAARTGSTWIALAARNRIADPNLIMAGWGLVVPPPGWNPPQATQAALWAALGVGTTAPPVSTAQPVSQPATVHTQPVAAAPLSAPGSFQACVEMRESTDGAGSSDLFGFLQSTWTANGFPGSPYTASPAQQVAAFQTVYARDGTAPWAPYDGC